MFTPELVGQIPTKALRDVGSTLEALDGLVADLDDYELFVITLDAGLQTAIHVIDAELQRRPLLGR